MAANDQRPHIMLEGFSATQGFATPHSGRANFIVAERGRREHGRNLLGQLGNLSEAAEQRIEAQHAFSEDIPNGIYLEFESEPGFELATESLEREPSGIELLSVIERGTRFVATVFVPEGKLEHFERLVRAYLETRPDAQGAKPRHQALLNNISRIRIATLRALWTDDPTLYPRDPATPVWWEVWLRVGDDRNAYLTLLREHGPKIGLVVSSRSLGFLERTVVAVKGTVRQMTQSMRLLNCIAELRRLKETANYFIDLKRAEQAAWADDFGDRIIWPDANVPAVCLLDTGVVRTHPLLLQGFAPGDLHTINPDWTEVDTTGHGTGMAGLALHGDLTEVLLTTGPVPQLHRGESVKLLDADGGNQGELYGALTREAIARAEVAAPQRPRSICMAVTAKEDRDRGKPSSWSATIDALASGAEDERRRLILVCAGNTDPNQWQSYPDSNATDSIHDPAQAWNALTVGAFTYKTEIDLTQNPDAVPLAPYGDLSPFSCTSETWEKGWPVKPDIVMEGGNLASTPPLGVSDLAELQLLTTHHRPLQRSFDLMAETSAATALASRVAARIQAHYPSRWPETVRGLLVHSASWSPAMVARYQPEVSRSNAKRLLSHCGHGVPSEPTALWSASNALTLLVEAEITPFEGVRDTNGRITRFRAREMNLHALPWPIEELEFLGATQVEMRVTLSYFVEPNPSARGWTKRYLYESHGLRFDVKRPLESDADFLERINLKARAEEDTGSRHSVPDDGWLLGPTLRHMGSLHSDRWRGSASDLASRGQIGVYPTMGWWRERRKHERWNSRARYALIVSITTPATDVDLYAAVQTTIEAATVTTEVG
jgi:Subtilase family